MEPTTGRDAAILSAVEIGLGSALHALHVPLAGQFLSLNQGFILSRSTLKGPRTPQARWEPMRISNIAAILKSLSPAGKKLEPMLALSAQGALFGMGVLVLGCNFVGVLAGFLLLSLWAFVQPFVTYYFLFGNNLVKTVEYAFHKFSAGFPFARESLIWVIGAGIAIKLLLALVLVFTADRIPEARFKRYQDRLLKKGQAKRRALLEETPETSLSQKAVFAVRDLFNPLFLISLGMTAFFLIYSEASFASVIWGLMRPLAFGFLLFFAIRAIPLSTWPGSPALQKAIKTLKEL